MNTFNPNQIISSSDLNSNFTDIADGTGIEDEAITNSHITQDDWTAPTFENSWVNYGSVYAEAGYIKDNMGFVHLRGLVKNGTSATADIFSLPVGYRPNKKTQLIACCYNNTTARISIDTDGDVYAEGSGSTTWISLDGVKFKAGQE